MYHKCCVENCGSRRRDINLYKFPKNETNILKWLNCIKCPKLLTLSFEVLRKHHMCKKHFEPRFFSSSHSRSRLYTTAYPTLFTDEEIATGIPQSSLSVPEEIEWKGLDHSYALKRRHEDHTYCSIEKETNKRSKIETEMSTADALMSQQNDEQQCSISVPAHNHTANQSSDKESTITQQNEEPLSSTSVPGQDYTNKQMRSDMDTCISTTPKRRKHIAPKFAIRKRIITAKKALTPNCRELYREYVKSRKQLEFSQRARRCTKFLKNETYEKLTEKLNPTAKKILLMQIKQSTKKAKGRRFTDEEKLIAVSIMKQSPKCYNFLQKIFILPSKSTLNKMISELNVEAGINEQIFKAVTQEVSTWEENKKYCSILFDEMALEAGLTYDRNKDLIDGFVELNAKTDDFADHALVFMLRGAIHKWQQPLVFYFCKGATSAINLKNIIKQIVVAVGDAGLLPICLACDQGTSFQSALKSLQEDTQREQMRSGGKLDDVISINGHTLSVIFDPPHLLKGLRNNFLNKNIKMDGKISKWSDIVEVYNTDCSHAQMRLLHKLNDEHVIPEKIKKMKVKNCARVLSKTVAAAMNYTAQFSHYVDGRKVSETLKNTAEIVYFFDDLFDSLNGASINNKRNKGKPLRQAVTEKSAHHQFWRDAISKLESLKFVDSTGKETSVPSLKNWVTTLKSFQRLWQFLQSKNVKVMRPRYFNSDPIENFFGQVRAYNFRNNDPDCHNFKSTFRSLLITRFIKFHSNSFNCEDDSSKQLLKLKTLFAVKSCENEEMQPSNGSAGPSNIYSQIMTPSTACQQRLQVHSKAYTAGWAVRKILATIKCKQCEKDLISSEAVFDKQSVNNWISFREFKSVKKLKLAYPTEHAVRLFSCIIDEANRYLECHPNTKKIKQHIKSSIASKYTIDFLSCGSHKKEVINYFLDLTLNLCIHNWCSTINRILKGTDISRLENKNLPPMQLKALNKYKTKLKNKRLNK
ncbi:hypothetical protein O0L34_g19047 [Tuta absoluta]|nr:hypothetical protein O0L34_g19047 [Tuta absoluta]